MAHISPLELPHFFWFKALLSKNMMKVFISKLVILHGLLFFFYVKSSNFVKIRRSVGLSGLHFWGIWFYFSVCTFELLFFRNVFLNYSILVHVLFYCSGLLLCEFICGWVYFPIFICHSLNPVPSLSVDFLYFIFSSFSSSTFLNYYLL